MKSNLPYNKGLKILASLVLTLALAFFIRTSVLGIQWVQGNSMLPSLPHNSLVLNIRQPILKWLGVPIHRGDIYSFYYEEAQQILIKRIVGLPGDKLWINDGVLYINGSVYQPTLDQLDKAGMTIECRYTPKYEVPEDEYFLLGDNLCKSVDSRFFGSIKATQLHSKVWRVLYLASP